MSLLISAMLLLGCFALAEETPLLPIAIVSYDLTDEATTAALSALIEPKENALTRWERVVLSDGREAWVICQFDQTTMSNAWSRVIDAETQEVLQEDTTDTGFFATAQARWESAKGIYALWSIQDKMLFDRLYAMAPCYGEPVEGDLTQEEALAAALNVTQHGDAGRKTRIDFIQARAHILTEAAVTDAVDLRDGNVLTVGGFHAFGDDDQTVIASLFANHVQLADDAVKRVRNFGNQAHVGTAGNRGMQSDMSRVASHDFANHNAVMRRRRRIQTIQSFDANVARRRKSDGMFGDGRVVVNGLGNADHRDARAAAQSGND